MIERAFGYVAVTVLRLGLLWDALRIMNHECRVCSFWLSVAIDGMIPWDGLRITSHDTDELAS